MFDFKQHFRLVPRCNVKHLRASALADLMAMADIEHHSGDWHPTGPNRFSGKRRSEKS